MNSPAVPEHHIPIPSVRQCLALMEQYNMLANIRDHSLVVARVGEYLATALQKTLAPACQPDHALVRSGALLHDIAKTACLNNGGDHAVLGARICEAHGYPEVGQIVREHVLLNRHDPHRYRQGHFSASEIVYYADKRVRHAQIVSLKERLTYILDRYARHDSRRRAYILANFARCQELEHHLFAHLDISPGELADQAVAGLGASELGPLLKDIPITSPLPQPWMEQLEGTTMNQAKRRR